MKLQGAKVLVTRPAAQAEHLCRLIEAEGGESLRFPLMAIQPVPQASEARQRLAAGHDLWIFTSANAARHSAPLISGPWPSRVAAVGPATAAALATAPVVTVPVTGSSSEALLALPELQDVAGQRVLVVTGEGGLGLLEAGLAERGAQVQRADVYRRVPLPYPADTTARFLRKANVMVVTSAQGLERLLVLAPPDLHASLKRKPLVLPSTRVIERAKDLGFSRATMIVEPMSDVALLAACLDAYQNR